MINSSKNGTKLLFDSVTLITLRPYYSIVCLSMKVTRSWWKIQAVKCVWKCWENTIQFSTRGFRAFIPSAVSSVRLFSSRFAARTCTVEHCSQSPILWSAWTWWNILPSQQVHLKWAFSLEEWYSIFSLCEILKRLRKLKQSGFKTINLQPAHEAEVHALHWKQSLSWTWTTWFAALKTLCISPLVAKEFLMSVMSCWLDMTKFRLCVMQQIFGVVLLIWASRQLKWPFAAAVSSELSLHLTSLQLV